MEKMSIDLALRPSRSSRERVRRSLFGLHQARLGVSAGFQSRTDQLPHHFNGRSIYYKQTVEPKTPGWPAWLKPMRRTKIVEDEKDEQGEKDEKEEKSKAEWEWDRKPLPEVPRSRGICPLQGASSQGASSHIHLTQQTDTFDNAQTLPGALYFYIE